RGPPRRPPAPPPPGAGPPPPPPGGPPGPPPLPPPVTLTVGQLGGAGELMMFIAQDRGYWREEGLDVKLVDFRTSSDMVAPMASGELDIGAGGVNAGFFNVVGQGIPLKLVADKGTESREAQNCVWMVRSELIDSGQVREPRDVKGLNFGVGSVASIIDIQIARILELGGLTDDDINVKQVSFADQLASFANKSTDIAYVFEPTRTRLLDEGLAKVWRTCGELSDELESGVLLYGPSMEGKQEAGRRFMVGYVRGVRAFLEEGPDTKTRTPQIIDLAIKETSVKDPALWRKMELQWANPDGYNYPDRLERALRWFADRGLVQ